MQNWLGEHGGFGRARARAKEGEGGETACEETAPTAKLRRLCKNWKNMQNSKNVSSPKWQDGPANYTVKFD